MADDETARFSIIIPRHCHARLKTLRKAHRITQNEILAFLIDNVDEKALAGHALKVREKRMETKEQARQRAQAIEALRAMSPQERKKLLKELD